MTIEMIGWRVGMNPGIRGIFERKLLIGENEQPYAPEIPMGANLTVGAYTQSQVISATGIPHPPIIAGDKMVLFCSGMVHGCYPLEVNLNDYSIGDMDGSKAISPSDPLVYNLAYNAKLNKSMNMMMGDTKPCVVIDHSVPDPYMNGQLTEVQTRAGSYRVAPYKDGFVGITYHSDGSFNYRPGSPCWALSYINVVENTVTPIRLLGWLSSILDTQYADGCDILSGLDDFEPGTAHLSSEITSQIHIIGDTVYVPLSTSMQSWRYGIVGVDIPTGNVVSYRLIDREDPYESLVTVRMNTYPELSFSYNGNYAYDVINKAGGPVVMRYDLLDGSLVKFPINFGAEGEPNVIMYNHVREEFFAFSFVKAEFGLRTVGVKFAPITISAS